MDTPVFFGDWLRQRRKTLDFTQEELAERAGCTVFALRKIESGERRPSKQLAGLLAAALEISEEEQPAFIRVARGELNLERLPISKPDTPNPSISEFLTRRQTRETVPPPGAGLEPDSPLLPIPPTPLLGRDTELAALERLFNDPQCRLLTLTGMGGIGKTRLAIEFASRGQTLFSSGVYYVPLASIDSVESIIPAVAEVLGYSFSGPADLKEQVIKHMSVKMKRPSLLVLDNLEHLIAQSPATAGLVSEFLQRLPRLKILTTSRERLNLQGEWMYELHGLPVPPVEFADRLDDYSAPALFLQRAGQIRTDFELSDSEKTAIVRICRLVEGIPLAIELAAAWVGMLTCAEIAHEIESNIDFLSTAMRDVPERHRSLRATFDHSWNLLSDPERDMLSRLSVFRGGFDRSAAEKVAGAALAHLASLASKSLVWHSGQGRYDLHEVIRQYASAHLESDPERCTGTCERHSRYYLNLAAGYEKKLKSALQQEAMREMTLELDNLRTAWEWGIRRGNFDSVGRAIRSFGWFFEVAGMMRDGIEQLEGLVRALGDAPRDLHTDRALGTTLVQQGLLCFRTGQFIRAQELYNAAIATLRPVNEPGPLADALIFSGTLMHLMGNYPEARTLIEEGLLYARAANDPWFTAYGVYNLGHVDSLMGEYSKGYEQMQAGLKIWREVGDPHSISLGLNFLVNTQIKLGLCVEAEASMRESILLCEQTKNRWGMGTAYRYLGLANLAGGRVAEAQANLRKSLEIFGEDYVGWDIALTLIYLGEAALASGSPAEAEGHFVKALRLAGEARSQSLMLDALAGLADFEKRSGRDEASWELSSIVLGHPFSAEETKSRSAGLKQDAEDRLARDRVQALEAGLSDLSLEAAVERYLAG